MNAPHFLRFTRTLALGAGLSIAGCGASTAPTDGSSGDSAQRDSSSNADVAQSDSAEDSMADRCASCTCANTVPVDGSTEDSGVPVCTGELAICCAAVGPLAPPELTA